MLVIGIKGKAGSGKDTVSDYLVANHNFKKVSFSTALKKVCAIITGWPLECMYGDTKEAREFRETVVHPMFGMTCRQLMQTIGTEVFRNHFDADIWVKLAKREAEDLMAAGYNVVFADVRFENEAATVRNLGGKIFHLIRPISQENFLMSQTTSMHVSEQYFETDGEITVHNSGTLEQLYKNIDNALSKC